MTVYVDEIVEHPTGAIEPVARRHGRKWCHMFADTLEELHAFAKQLGLRRAWFQNKRLPHYDLVPSKRRRALEMGAQEASLRDIIG